MSDSLGVQLCNGLGEYLAAAGKGWSWSSEGLYTASETGITVQAVPPAPNRLIVLTPIELGSDPARANVLFNLQVRVRSAGADPRDAINLGSDVTDVLCAHWSIHLPNGLYVSDIGTAGGFAPLGQDENTPPRWGRTRNYHLTVHRTGTQRH